jgi:co-chaperonin GroES (HSP10)
MTDLYIPAYRVVIKQTRASNKTSSGIITESEQSLRRKQAASTTGTIVGVGPVAFTGKDYGEGDRDMFKVGTEVVYRRYAGQVYTEGDDDPNADVLQIMNDTDVLMPVPKGKTLTLVHAE